MRTVRHITLMLLLVALAAPAAAQAGGWATVEVDQPVGLGAGDPWRAELLVKQHGITPLDGVTPSIRIANDEGVVKTFVARPAGKPGTYVATVTYPSAGTWRTRIFDGFTDVVPHRLPPVVVAPAGKGGEVTAADRRAVLPAADRDPVAAADERGAAAPTAAPTDDGFPWPQVIAIAVVALMFAAAWMIGTGGTFRRRDRRGGGTAPAAVAGGPQARS